MKKVLITMTLLLTLSMGVEAASQKHRHTPQQAELVDSTSKDAVEAFSDTTSTGDTDATHKKKVTVTTRTSPWSSSSTTYEMDEDEDFGDAVRHVFSSMDADGVAGMLFVLAVLFIIFVLAPVLIIIALFYFINKNRKQKMKLAQMAMQNGQPIPEQLLEDKPGDVDDEYQKGMRQCFVGVGLMIFLGYAAGNVGFGVGALVFCIGLGKVFAAKTAQKKNDNNDLMHNDYD
ncbi:MAG: hypothetical protein II822_06265 [Prevotella sp.]|nr:hypothetical protein [Prevotella sp.]